MFKNKRNIGPLVVASISGVLLVGSLVHAATTISTNITTDGTISITGLSTFLGGATTTTLTLLNGETISNATDGVIQLDGIASTTSITLLNGETITNATDGTITLGATNVTLIGTASTSALKVGDENSVSTINGLIFGYCSFGNTTVNASTTGYVICTGATGVQTTDRVFVQATSSLDTAFIIQAASSTAADTISLRVFNHGLGTADNTLGAASVNFWAVRP